MMSTRRVAGGRGRLLMAVSLSRARALNDPSRRAAGTQPGAAGGCPGPRPILRNMPAEAGGDQAADRDLQFQCIAEGVIKFQRQRQPGISVDAKNEELIGDFKNAGRDWHLQGQPEQVREHDVIDDEPGKVAPCGVCVVTANLGVGQRGDRPRPGRVRGAKHPPLVAREGAADLHLTQPVLGNSRHNDVLIHVQVLRSQRAASPAPACSRIVVCSQGSVP